MDPLLVYPVVLPKTIPVGVSNDLVLSEKGHPFFEQTIHNLIKFDHSWILNYPTVMFSTGPMFLSVQYGLYMASHPKTALQDVRILPKSLYGKNAREDEAPHSFFSHFYGSSWHADDAAFIGFLGNWGKGLMWIGLLILIIGLFRLPSKPGRRFTRSYDIILPRLSRSGRWHLHLGRSSFSTSGTSTQLPSPSSEGVSPIEAELPVLHLPFGNPTSSPEPDSLGYSDSDPYAGRVQSPLVEAFRRVRNRVSSMTNSYQAPPDTPIRPGPRHSRRVMFFLPAIFTQTPDIELQPAPPGRSNARATRTSRHTGRTALYPNEKDRYRDDIETGHDSGSGSQPFASSEYNEERPSRTRDSSRIRSPSNSTLIGS